jgi:hypothetical protein
MNAGSSQNPQAKSVFLKLLATGIVGWLTVWILLFGLAFVIEKPETVELALMWSLSRWWIAFLAGAVLLIVRALQLRAKPVPALAAYLLPLCLVAVIGAICVAVYPDWSFRGDLFDFMPLTLVFYLLGLAWASFSKEEHAANNFKRTVLPPLLGGCLIVGMIAVPVFTSNYFIYRNAFALKVSKVAIENGAMTVDGTLEIHKAGHYAFTAPRYSYQQKDDGTDFESLVEQGQITWGNEGPPKDGAPGMHPFKIRWEKNIPPDVAALQSVMAEETAVFMEVRDADQDSEELIFNLSAPIPGVPRLE